MEKNRNFVFPHSRIKLPVPSALIFLKLFRKISRGPVPSALIFLKLFRKISRSDFVAQTSRGATLFIFFFVFTYQLINLSTSFALDLDSAGAQAKNEIAVTAVEVYNSTYTITINDCLKIADIKIVCDEEGKNCLKFGEYLSKDNKTVPYVAVLNDEAKNIIEEAIYNNKPSGEITKSVNYKVTNISLYEDEKSNVKALGTVVFNEAISVEVRVVETEQKLWIMWPMKQEEAGRWVNIVEVTKKPVRDFIEKMVIKKYEKLR